MARDGVSGWYCDIPTKLKQQFEELYPGRSAKKKLTVAAIQRAIERHPEVVARQQEKKQVEN